VDADAHLSGHDQLRLFWLLGRLDAARVESAWQWVHLGKELAAGAASFGEPSRFDRMRTQREGSLLQEPSRVADLALAEDYLHGVEADIRLFLRNKPTR
jgi:hypothetical protein